MKTFIATLALACLVAFPAFAQSYDPDLGTGNIVGFSNSTSYGASLVQRVPAGAVRVAPGSPTAAYAAVTPFDTAAGVKGSAAERDSALRECSVISRRYQQTTWANMDIQQHRACMAQHGQPE